MFKPKSPSEQLLFTTALIEAPLSNGLISRGTGFFFAFPFGKEKEITMLVTNKHVILKNPKQEIRIHIHTCDSDGNIDDTWQSISYSPQWIFHPDPNVDLCMCNVAELSRVCSEQVNRNLFCTAIREKDIPSREQLEQLSAMEDIVMIGYPNALCDYEHGLPLIRRGITASHPALSFNGKNEGAMDICVIPGSSGSPVFILNEGPYTDKNREMQFQQRVLFLGINYAVATWDTRGNVRVTIDDGSGNHEADGTTSVKMPINIGYYIKSSEMLALKNACVYLNPLFQGMILAKEELEKHLQQGSSNAENGND